MVKLSENEARVERERVEQVFGLTGGELADDAWAGFAYWYEGTPAWAWDDFEDSKYYRGKASPDYHTHYRTVIALDRCYGFNPPAIEGWEFVRDYTHSGETECPLRNWDPETNSSPKYPEVCKVNGPGLCPYCEAEAGEDHGFIYLGPSVEAVYREIAGPETED